MNLRRPFQVGQIIGMGLAIAVSVNQQPLLIRREANELALKVRLLNWLIGLLNPCISLLYGARSRGHSIPRQLVGGGHYAPK